MVLTHIFEVVGRWQSDLRRWQSAITKVRKWENLMLKVISNCWVWHRQQYFDVTESAISCCRVAVKLGHDAIARKKKERARDSCACVFQLHSCVVGNCRNGMSQLVYHDILTQPHSLCQNKLIRKKKRYSRLFRALSCLPVFFVQFWGLGPSSNERKKGLQTWVSTSLMAFDCGVCYWVHYLGF